MKQSKIFYGRKLILKNMVAIPYIKNISNIKIKWQTWERFLRIIEIFAIIIGVAFTVVQIRDIRNNQSAQLMLEFNKELSDGTNLKIITAIEDNKPVFKENGGEFNISDIDNYLSVYELMNNTYEAGLINDDMLYNGFSYDIQKTYENKEIKDYLVRIKKDDELLFSGFERLAKSVEISN